MLWPSRNRLSRPGQIKLTSERVYLRPALVSDYPQWAKVRGRNRDYLMPFEPAWPEDSLDQDFFRRRVVRLDHDWLTDRTYAFLIFDLVGGLIGGININNVVRGAAQQATLGYWLDEAKQGQGYMTEAGLVVLDYAFRPLQLARMNAATLVHNDKSKAMLKRLGFVEEGFARAYIQINGLRQDHILFGLNAGDFLRAARQS
jgi:ribosomal-protein-alanine N-acetyltransferase